MPTPNEQQMMAQAIRGGGVPHGEPDADNAVPVCPQCGCPCPYCSGQMPPPDQGAQPMPMPPSGR